MKWHLDHTPANPGYQITHSDPVMLIGSCFAEHIGEKLKDHRFPCHVNPTGNLFNPISIARTLEDALEMKAPDQELFVERAGSWFSFAHHSRVNGPTADSLFAIITALQLETMAFLEKTSVLVITFGSAHIYELEKNNVQVANCHKQPQQLFSKRLLSIQEIVEQFTSLHSLLKSRFPKLKMIFTVSPVKYLRDGVVGNSISKSTLILAVHELCRLKDCSYFPAYELVADDLRDHRFYNEDLSHPNSQAIDYVWEKFSACFFSDDTRSCNVEISRLNTAMQHRPLHHNKLERERLENYVTRQKELIARMQPSIQF